MKMDAMQKRRMWKVAIAHFGLTAFVFCKLFRIGPDESQWHYSWLKLFYSFQPQFLIVSADFQIFLFASISLWSICFGWLYVKFTNWLNHFSVLGKRVF
jgi:hypothetical protein